MPRPRPQGEPAPAFDRRALPLGRVDARRPGDRRDLDGESLTELVGTHPASTTSAIAPAGMDEESEIALGAAALERTLRLGSTSAYACPHCHGVLVRVDDQGSPRFRCHTGHALTATSLLEELTDDIEVAFSQALRGLDERAMLLELLAGRAREAEDTARADEQLASAQRTRARADRMRRVALEEW